MPSVKIQNAANCATIFAALVAAGSFYYGYHQFRKTQEDTRKVLTLQEQTLDQDRESRAVDLFVKYNETMSAPQVGHEFWRDNLGLSIAESIFRLRSNDAGWQETVTWMLSNHAKQLKRNGLNCPSYDPAFVKLANKATKDDLCKPR